MSFTPAYDDEADCRIKRETEPQDGPQQQLATMIEEQHARQKQSRPQEKAEKYVAAERDDGPTHEGPCQMNENVEDAPAAIHFSSDRGPSSRASDSASIDASTDFAVSSVRVRTFRGGALTMQTQALWLNPSVL